MHPGLASVSPPQFTTIITPSASLATLSSVTRSSCLRRVRTIEPIQATRMALSTEMQF